MSSVPMLPDTDLDGLADHDEMGEGPEPRVPDTDGDGVLDGADVFGVCPTSPTDADDDGLTDGEEAAIGAIPTSADPDNGGLTDREERVLQGSHPTLADSDGDSDGDPGEIGHVSGPIGNVRIRDSRSPTSGRRERWESLMPPGAGIRKATHSLTGRGVHDGCSQRPRHHHRESLPCTPRPPMSSPPAPGRRPESAAPLAEGRRS